MTNKEGDRDSAGEIGREMCFLEEENATLRRRLGIPSGPPKSTLASLEGEKATLRNRLGLPLCSPSFAAQLRPPTPASAPRQIKHSITRANVDATDTGTNVFIFSGN